MAKRTTSKRQKRGLSLPEFHTPVIHRHDLYGTEHHPRGPFGVFNNPQGNRRIRYDQLFEFLFEKVKPRKNPGVPFTYIDPSTLDEEPKHYRLSWIGHATCLLQTPSMNIITDPVFAARVSPVGFAGPKRFVGLPLSLHELPRIDYVILSHNHYDHLDKKAAAALDRLWSPTWLVPIGVRRQMRNWRITRVIELDWWEYVELDGARFHCLPARHFSGRSVTDYNRTLWVSWMAELPAENFTMYFAGDTAYGDHFKAIGEHFDRIDMALMPVGAYLPRAMMEPIHVNPDEGVQGFIDMGAEEMLAIHWGTYDLATEPVLQPMHRTRELIAEHNLDPDKVHILPVGGVIER